MGERLHVRIDAKICQGTGYCERVAPAVFALQGRQGVVIDQHPEPDRRGLLEEAATLCPTRAITY